MSLTMSSMRWWRFRSLDFLSTFLSTLADPLVRLVEPGSQVLGHQVDDRPGDAEAGRRQHGRLDRGPGHLERDQGEDEDAADQDRLDEAEDGAEETVDEGQRPDHGLGDEMAEDGPGDHDDDEDQQEA